MAPDGARIAFVTGAARGIGAATVEALCGQGYSVVALDSCSGPDRPNGVNYDLATVDQLEELARRYPQRVVAKVVDARDATALAAAASQTVEHFGRLDVVVAAAAVIAGGTPLWETPLAALQTMLEVDVVGVWNTAAATVPHLLASSSPSGCRFVAIASAAGSQGMFHLAGYNVAKHAVIGLVRGLAADLVGTGVTAVAVSPGSTDTQMLQATADLYGIENPEHFASSQHLQRLLTPAEVASTIAFCCSIEGCVLNGSVVDATGGFSG